MSLNAEHVHDPKGFEHYVNGHLSVIHGHAYLALVARLAERFSGLGGIRLLRDCAEDSMLALLRDYHEHNGVVSPGDRMAVAEAHYRAMGLGRLVLSGDETGGEGRLTRSHIDEAWSHQWGKHYRSINHLTCGFCAAAFAAAYDRPGRSYAVTEKASLAAGDDAGVFSIKLT